MSEFSFKSALIIGAGPGISASLARAFAAAGLQVSLAARNIEKLEALGAETGAELYAADVAVPGAVSELFRAVEEKSGAPEVVVYNASARAQGAIAELDPDAVRRVIDIGAFGAFLAVQEAARRMVPRGQGAIFLTGATASLKGYAQSSAFAMAKFALRGLAQSAARELGPKGIHVAHFVIDGGVRSAAKPDPADNPDSRLCPDAIAQSYMDVLRQSRSAWSQEVELRPWVERF